MEKKIKFWLGLGRGKKKEEAEETNVDGASRGEKGKKKMIPERGRKGSDVVRRDREKQSGNNVFACKKYGTDETTSFPSLLASLGRTGLVW